MRRKTEDKYQGKERYILSEMVAEEKGRLKEKFRSRRGRINIPKGGNF